MTKVIRILKAAILQCLQRGTLKQEMFLIGNVKLDKQFQEFVNKLKSNYRDTVMGLCN